MWKEKKGIDVKCGENRQIWQMTKFGICRLKESKEARITKAVNLGDWKDDSALVRNKDVQKRYGFWRKDNELCFGHKIIAFELDGTLEVAESSFLFRLHFWLWTFSTMPQKLPHPGSSIYPWTSPMRSPLCPMAPSFDWLVLPRMSILRKAQRPVCLHLSTLQALLPTLWTFSTMTVSPTLPNNLISFHLPFMSYLPSLKCKLLVGKDCLSACNSYSHCLGHCLAQSKFLINACWLDIWSYPSFYRLGNWGTKRVSDRF